MNEYTVFSNDSERAEIGCDSWEEAVRICANLNEEADMDTKYWVEATF